MSTLPTFEHFAADEKQRGCDEVLVRTWSPGQVVAEHTHPFAARALVVQGEMWLSCGGETRQLRPGDRFELAAHEPHAERYGREGATYWVARTAAG